MIAPKTIRSHGITLMEVILAAALSAVLLAGVMGGIHYYMVQLNVSQTGVQQAQLARAIMRMIESDLRSAVWKAEVDLSSLDQMASNSMSSSLSGMEDMLGEDMMGELDLLAPEMETDPLGMMLDSGTPPTVGMFGNTTEIRFDVSRLPRPDQYEQQFLGLSEQRLADMPSDIKTVNYFLVQPGVTGFMHGEVGEATEEVPQMGLARREIDRAVTNYALNMGNIIALDAAGEILAAEVTFLMFRYTDGFQWYDQWDSEVMTGLPLAVEVTIALRSVEQTEKLIRGEPLAPEETTDPNAIQGTIFRRLIRVPTGKRSDATMTSDQLGTTSGAAMGASGL
ncbi:MAG: hypothetical protein WDZ51_19545 [Pirellulaceae bacterium]